MIELIKQRRAVAIEDRIRALVAKEGATPLKHAVRDVTVGIVVAPANWYVERGVPAVRGINVSPGRIDIKDCIFLSDEGHRINRKSTIRTGDVLVVRTGQAGAAAVVPPELDGANCIDVLLIRPSISMSAHFIEYVINSDWTVKYIAQHSVGTIQAHFNVGALRELPVPVPPIASQHRLVEALDAACGRADKTLLALTSQIALLVERRQALITAAVTGELDSPGAA